MLQVRELTLVVHIIDCGPLHDAILRQVPLAGQFSLQFGYTCPWCLPSLGILTTTKFHSPVGMLTFDLHFLIIWFRDHLGL